MKILLFLGLAKLGSEQIGPGATLLGWPISIYYIGHWTLSLEGRK